LAKIRDIIEKLGQGWEPPDTLQIFTSQETRMIIVLAARGRGMWQQRTIPKKNLSQTVRPGISGTLRICAAK
jgi:hypothetical protein